VVCRLPHSTKSRWASANGGQSAPVPRQRLQMHRGLEGDAGWDVNKLNGADSEDTFDFLKSSGTESTSTFTTTARACQAVCFKCRRPRHWRFWHTKSSADTRLGGSLKPGPTSGFVCNQRRHPHEKLAQNRHLESARASVVGAADGLKGESHRDQWERRSAHQQDFLAAQPHHPENKWRPPYSPREPLANNGPLFRRCLHGLMMTSLCPTRSWWRIGFEGSFTPRPP